jgi:hypothetical protein
MASTRWRMPSSWRRPLTKSAGSTSNQKDGAHFAAGGRLTRLRSNGRVVAASTSSRTNARLQTA